MFTRLGASCSLKKPQGRRRRSKWVFHEREQRPFKKPKRRDCGKTPSEWKIRTNVADAGKGRNSRVPDYWREGPEAALNRSTNQSLSAKVPISDLKTTTLNGSCRPRPYAVPTTP